MAIEAKAVAGQVRRIRFGMVGGGEGAFIGGVHRFAARLDDQYELVAGALASSPEKALRSGAALGLAADRTYSDFATMASAEAARADGIEAVAIVTPNHMHASVAEAFLKAGIHVICDKPLAVSSKDARKLHAMSQKQNLLFAVTYNYTGYPMVRQMRQMVRDGQLGDIRVVQVEYPQDWLTDAIEASGQKQAGWRTDPAKAGLGGCIGDIGTHAYQLADYVTGIAVTEVLAELTAFVPGRRLDDNAHVILRFANGARGTLWSSQVAPGNENNLRLRIYGSKGGLEWRQELPNQLYWSPFGQATQVIARGTSAAGADASRVTRIPSGHPEGYLEAFATIYSEIGHAIRSRRAKGPTLDQAVQFPTVIDGVKGVIFVESVVSSSAKGGKWVKVPAV